MRFVWLVILWTITGCFHSEVKPLPKLSGDLMSVPDTESFVASVEADDKDIHSMRVLWNASFRVRKEKNLLRYGIVFVKPDQLRVEALPRTAAYSLSLLVGRDGRVVFVDPPGKRGFRGQFGSGVVKQILGIPLSEQELMSCVAGRVPQRLLGEGGGLGSLRAYDDASANVTELTRGGLRYYWMFHREDRDLMLFQMRDQFRETLELEVQYDDYRSVGEMRVPYRIIIRMPSESVEVELTAKRVSVNEKYPDQLFHLEIPSDYRISELR